MDSERMTVSDAEEVNLDNEVNLKMAQKIQINLLGLGLGHKLKKSVLAQFDERKPDENKILKIHSYKLNLKK